MPRTAIPKTLCLNNCGRIGNRRRGLCPSCYAKKDVRDRFPSNHTRSRELDFDDSWEPPQPDFATQAMPGSAEKVAIMEARVKLGQHPHHRGDAKLSDPRTDECDRELIQPGENRDPFGVRRAGKEEMRAKPVKEVVELKWPRDPHGQLLFWEHALGWRSRRSRLGRR